MVKKHTMDLVWEKVGFSELDEVEDCHFYAFTRGNSLLYLGMTWDQDIQSEVKQSLKDFGANNLGLSIWMGYIVKTSAKRLSPQLIQDAEALLIRNHGPLWNNHHVHSYRGRDNLVLSNTGLPLLNLCIQIRGETIYYTNEMAV